MTLQAKSFGSKCTPSEKFITGVSKSGIVESVLSWARFKAQNDVVKTSGKKNAYGQNMNKDRLEFPTGCHLHIFYMERNGILRERKN